MENNLSPVVITREYARKLLPKRDENSNKGSFGSIINISGSIMYPGASYLSSISALKVGAGLVRLATTTNVIPIVASLSPEITFIDLGESSNYTIPKDANKILKELNEPSVYSIGCGLSLDKGVQEFVLSFIKNNKTSQTPIIIDADAINTISQTSKDIILPLNSIITPHPLELSRLIDVPVEEIQSDRIKYAWETSKEFDCIVLLKGKNTVIAVPNGQIFINETGNSALAKGGSGDVLTGMISGFAAQGLNLENATCLACYLHGLSGEIASSTQTEYGVLATNLINSIPLAIKTLI